MSLRRLTVAPLLFIFSISPYEMSLRRPTVASLLFIISPFRDVAQTSDCGIAVIYFHYKPFPRCRIDV